MADRWVLALVAAAVSGAVAATQVPLPAPLLITGLCGVLALGSGRSLLVCLALAALVSELGHRAEAGLAPPEPGPVRAEVVLLTDPQPSGPGLRADARLGGRRVLLRARGPATEALTDRLAGEHVTIAGELEPVGPASWLRARHVVASVTVWRVEGWRPGSPVTRAANALRRTLESGAAHLPRADRTLFTGLVIGDDRDLTPEEDDAFRATGLTHLTAVSGQNVALVLAIASPLLLRLRLWPRLLATLLVVAGFGLVTRFEPSVLRASALAAVAAVSVTVGQPLDRLRALGLAVVGLLVVDPLLVHAVGFQLSVAATAGIVVGTGPLTAALPGPRVVREPLALATAAQVGVAPVLLATFGPVPLASLPANVLAVPAKALVMVWGLTGGLVAGVAGGGLAELLHLPTRLLTGWIHLVADRTAALPVGSLGALATAGASIGLLAAVGLRGRRPGLARLGAVVVLAVVAVAVGGANRPAPLRASPEHGVVVWRGGGATVVELSGRGRLPAPGPARVLEGVRVAGVRHVDLVVVGDARVDPAAVSALLRRYGTPAVVGPGGLPPALGATAVPPPGATVAVRGLEVDLVTAGARLAVDARPRSPGGR